VREIYRQPLHPYTLALLNSIPDPAAAKPAASSVISGELPSPLDPPSGCRFRTRCPRAQERCAAEVPQMRALSDGHLVACHFPLSGSWHRGAGSEPPAANGAPASAGL
jgi:oligopeptide/dipeptide ABC transporter ATP-binding protein